MLRYRDERLEIEIVLGIAQIVSKLVWEFSPFLDEGSVTGHLGLLFTPWVMRAGTCGQSEPLVGEADSASHRTVKQVAQRCTQ